MCLYLRDTIEHIVTSNIYVWKALIRGFDGYYSPVFSYRYNLGETYKSELDSPRDISINFISRGLHSIGYNVKISNPYAGRYDCYGSTGNEFEVRKPIDTIGLFIIPEGSYYCTDGYFYASDTLKFLRTLTINEFFNYMMNK